MTLFTLDALARAAGKSVATVYSDLRAEIIPAPSIEIVGAKRAPILFTQEEIDQITAQYRRPKINCFKGWLQTLKPGDPAYAFVVSIDNDPDFPCSDDYQRLTRYLTAKGVGPAVFEMFRDAFCRYIQRDA